MPLRVSAMEGRDGGEDKSQGASDGNDATLSEHSNEAEDQALEKDDENTAARENPGNSICDDDSQNTPPTQINSASEANDSFLSDSDRLEKIDPPRSFAQTTLHSKHQKSMDLTSLKPNPNAELPLLPNVPDEEKFGGGFSSRIRVSQVGSDTSQLDKIMGGDLPHFTSISGNDANDMCVFRDVFTPVESVKEVGSSETPVSSESEPVFEKQLNAYTAALKASNEAPKTWSRLFFGSSEDSALKEAEKALRAVYSERNYSEQAEAESMKSFRKQIIAAGGDPDVALEALAKGEGIFDPFSAQSLEQEMKRAPNLSIKKLEELVKGLSIKQIDHIINNSSIDYLNVLARKMFESPKIIPALDDKSLKEILQKALYRKSLVVQDELSLDGSKALSAIPRAFLQGPAPIEMQGLKNSGVDCYLSSALQCVRDVFSTLPHAKQQEILASLRNEYQLRFALSGSNPRLQQHGSPLAAFLEKKYDGRDPFAASFLRRELQGIMKTIAETGKYFPEEVGGEIADSMNGDEAASGAAGEIAQIIDPKEGASNVQSDASVALLILMELLKAPRAKVEETAHYFDSATGTHVTKLIAAQAQGAGLLILPFGVEGPSTIQDAIISNWNEEIPFENGIKDEAGEKHAFRREIKLANPPPSLTLSLKRFTYGQASEGQWGPQKLRTPISGLTGDVDIPVKPREEGGAEVATYTPSSIICHYGGESANSGHYATYRREGDDWFILNDDRVEMVRSLEEPSGRKFKDSGIDDRGEEIMSHREFLECNAYIVSYRRVE